MPLLRRKYLGNRTRSQRSEKRAAYVFSGTVQPASGAINRFDLKGDVKSPLFLVDDKTTDAQSFSVSLKTWRKLSQEAWMNKRRPAMRIEFTDGEPVYVVDEQTMLALIEMLEASRKQGH